MITPDATSYGDENKIVSKESIFSINGKEEDKKYEKETKDKINSITEIVTDLVNQNIYKKEFTITLQSNTAEDSNGKNETNHFLITNNFGESKIISVLMKKFPSKNKILTDNITDEEKKAILNYIKTNNIKKQ